MHIIAIILIVLIGAPVIIGAATVLLSERRKGWRRSVSVFAAFLMIVGALGFFGSALSAVGGLNWLSDSFEWPVGYTGGIVVVAGDFYAVPHTPSGRVQIYDTNWSFVRGWHVDAGAGTFKLFVPDDGHIHVVTARGNWHHVFDIDGNVISSTHYDPKTYRSFPDEGESHVIPTAFWLWPFTHPFIAWALLMAGLILIGVSQKKG